jgi:hypothetical protein
VLKRDNSFKAPAATAAEAASEARAASANAWRRRNGMLLYACSGPWLLTSLLLTSLLPNSWDRDSGALSALVSGVMTIVPSIGKYAQVSSFKGVTETYLAITWVLVFVTVVCLVFRSWPLDMRRRIPVTGRWTVFWLLALIVVVVGVGEFIGLRITPGMLSGYSLSARLLRSISSSRFALALFGTVLYVLQSILITSALVVGRNFRRLWLTSHSEHPHN